MDFQQLKIMIMGYTGLEKDALHIYIGISVYLIVLLLLYPMFKRSFTRQNIALLLATMAAIAGEVLDLRDVYPDIKYVHLQASLHDLINTCFWPYTLYALMRWTPILNTSANNPPKSVESLET